MVYRFMFVSTRMGRYCELLGGTHSQVRGSLGDGHSGAQSLQKPTQTGQLTRWGAKGSPSLVGLAGVPMLAWDRIFGRKCSLLACMCCRWSINVRVLCGWRVLKTYNEQERIIAAKKTSFC